MATDPRIGTVVAGYRIESLIGRGGMSVVYLAHHEGLERKAALKLLAPELAENDAFRQRFIRESRIAAGLDHPNVIPVYDAGETDGELFIAMRFVRGSDLRRLLDEHGPLDPADAVRVTDQLGAALDAAHAEGLVHRDVKPANVLLSPATPPAAVGHLYLADFGLTKKSLSGSGITKSGQFVGTIDYVAPEQIRSEPVDGRTDVYSLGCLLYECLTGEPPFVRDTEVAVMFSHLNDPPPAPSAMRPGLPAEVDHVVAKAMAKSPGDRYSTAGGMARAAQEVLGPAVASEVRASAPPPPPKRRRRTRAIVGGAGVAVVVAIAVVVAMVAGSGGTPGPASSTAGTGSTTPAASPTASVAPTAVLVPTGFSGVARIDPKSGEVADSFPLQLRSLCACAGESTRPLLAGEGAIWIFGGAFGPAEVLKVDPETGNEDPIPLLATSVETVSFAAGESSVWVLTESGFSKPDLLIRIDPGSDRILASIPIHGTGAGLAIGPEGVWVARTDGTLVEVDPGSNTIHRTQSVGDHGGGVALAGGDVWMSDPIAGALYRVDPTSKHVTTISLPGGADEIGGRATDVWVVDRAEGLVVRVDAASGDLDQIRVGERPTDIAVGSDEVWVTDQGEGSIYRIDAVSDEPTSFPVSDPATPPGPGEVSVGEGGVWTTIG